MRSLVFSRWLKVVEREFPWRLHHAMEPYLPRRLQVELIRLAGPYIEAIVGRDQAVGSEGRQVQRQATIEPFPEMVFDKSPGWSAKGITPSSFSGSFGARVQPDPPLKAAAIPAPAAACRMRRRVRSGRSDSGDRPAIVLVPFRVVRCGAVPLRVRRERHRPIAQFTVGTFIKSSAT